MLVRQLGRHGQLLPCRCPLASTFFQCFQHPPQVCDLCAAKLETCSSYWTTATPHMLQNNKQLAPPVHYLPPKNAVQKMIPHCTGMPHLVLLCIGSLPNALSTLAALTICNHVKPWIGSTSQREIPMRCCCCRGADGQCPMASKLCCSLCYLMAALLGGWLPQQTCQLDQRLLEFHGQL